MMGSGKNGVIYAVDLFAGAGGMSTGLALACKGLGRPVELVAVNHWKEAIEAHEKNHPWARHLHEDVKAVDPRKAVPGGHLHILTASPECTGHSRAAGGRPKNDQSRASAWHIMRWLELLRVDNLLVENVPELKDWGPLDRRRNPIKSRKGEVYQAWVSAIRSFGYTVDARVLNAADYGAPTSRSRLFIAAKKGRTTIEWPRPTHSREGAGRRRWRPARGIIDWSLEGQSIFGRKRPLVPNTMKRIFEGLKRFSSPEIRPFIIAMEHGGGIRDIEDPLPTITTARGGALALAEPFVLSQGSGGAPKKVDDPLPTIPGKGAHSLVQPFILHYHDGDGSDRRSSSIEEPLSTIDTSNRHALVEPCLVQYNGASEPQSVDEPLGTITTKDRFGLVEPSIILGDGTHYLDVRFRMLQVHELADAMGFPHDYQFAGTKTQRVKMVGNAVVVQVAQALCRSLLS
ncbi:MAG: DNA cytosine methyltransferase [Nitrososphaerota archaeon]|nr:DNA cytosine methyltransferase [Nitrososphaerota archaeon]